jgi:hypothetical protein
VCLALADDDDVDGFTFLSLARPLVTTVNVHARNNFVSQKRKRNFFFEEVSAGGAISLSVCVASCCLEYSMYRAAAIVYISVASCAVTDGRIVRTNAGTGGNGTAFVPYASGSGGSARQTVQISKCNRPTCTDTAFHLRDRKSAKNKKTKNKQNEHHWIIFFQKN